MRLDELFDPTGLDWCVEQGLVSRQTSRLAPGLTVLNYTHKCQYDRAWNECTTQCRGLIADLGGNVVARPFPKFFNAGEHGLEDGLLAAIDPDEPAELHDKLDGSLGILYPDSVDGGHRVATRGSFSSDQALHATHVWKTRYQAEVPVRGDCTYLFEIVYPANRVVVDYGGLDDLVLLAILHTGTHDDLTDRVYWPGRRAEVFGTMSLRRALELPPRAGAEGYVLKYRNPGRASVLVKLKQEDYVALHRIVTGLSERRVWEVARDAMAAGGADPAQAVEDLARGLPDEFAAFVWETHRRLTLDASAIKAEARFLHERLMGEASGRAEDEAGLRKAYAEASDGAPHRALLWMLYDGRPIDAAAWRLVRPAGEARPRELVE